MILYNKFDDLKLKLYFFTFELFFNTAYLKNMFIGPLTKNTIVNYRLTLVIDS